MRDGGVQTVNDGKRECVEKDGGDTRVNRLQDHRHKTWRGGKAEENNKTTERRTQIDR